MSDTALAADAAATPVAADAAAAAPAPKSLAQGAPVPGAAAPEAAADGADKPAGGDYFNEWKTKLAGDDAKLKAELDRIPDIETLWKKAKNAESRLTQKLAPPARPSADAKPEAVAEYRKAAGIPEAVDDYMKAVTLPEGVALGEADQTILQSFGAYAHGRNLAPEVVAEAVGWYTTMQEQQAAELDTLDAKNRKDAADRLDQAWGRNRDANINAMAVLFQDAPEGLFDRLMSGRMGDGRMIGDDPDAILAFSRWAIEMNPMASVAPSAGGSAGMDRLKEIEAFRKNNLEAYDNDKELQAEERRLIEAKMAQDRRGGRAA